MSWHVVIARPDGLLHIELPPMLPPLPSPDTLFQFDTSVRSDESHLHETDFFVHTAGGQNARAPSHHQEQYRRPGAATQLASPAPVSD